ncbi:MAG: hypothetical protein DWQ07_04830 [Chloroflexi bacterium]|nr:MAG: hypothetical protein DWQ07_04830 [Chloroflexota bacterium]MBL1194756.1 hypothetical protein [Chloroflexota bacterium]NOH12048.1 hypothetical protein [Chloroflexota bacterium]
MTKTKSKTNPLIYFVGHSITIWAQLIFNPTVESYRRIGKDAITEDSKRTNRWAYGWIIFVSVLTLCLYLWIAYNNSPERLWIETFLSIISFSLLIGLFTVYVGATQFFANRWLGGKGTFTKTLFVFSGFTSAILILSLIASAIMFLINDFLIANLSLRDYQALNRAISSVTITLVLILNIQAVRAVQRVSFFRAVIIILLSLVTLVILGFVLLPLIFGGIENFL